MEAVFLIFLALDLFRTTLLETGNLKKNIKTIFDKYDSDSDIDDSLKFSNGIIFKWYNFQMV